jgi:hypothetical protein
MAIEDLVVGTVGNVSDIVLSNALLSRVSHLITLFQAVGGFIIAYIVFNIVNIFWNKKKADETKKMRELLEQINKKLGKKR